MSKSAVASFSRVNENGTREVWAPEVTGAYARDCAYGRDCLREALVLSAEEPLLIHRILTSPSWAAAADGVKIGFSQALAALALAAVEG